MTASDPPSTKSTKSTARRVLLWVGGGLALVGALVLFYRLVLWSPPPPRWLTQKVTRGDVLQVISATGTVQPVVLSPVGAQVSGIVWKIHADYNDLVKKGQILVELDPALFQAAVRAQEANVASAQAALAKARADAVNAALAAQRARALVEKHYIAVADRDSAVAQEASTRAAVVGADANIKQAQAALDKAQLDLKNSVILSPVDGIVIARSVELGQAVVASFTAPNLFTIAEDLSKMQVLANVDEADIGHVRVGAMAEFTVDAFRGRRFHGKVGQIRNAALTVSNVVTYVVVLDVDNKDQLLRPGMTANVRLEVARRKDVLVIPAAALRFKPRLDQLFGSEPPMRGRRGGGEGGHKWRDGGDGQGHEGREGNKKHEGGEASPSDGKNGADFLERSTPATIYVPHAEQVAALPVTIGISDGMITEIRDGLTEDQVIVVDTAKPGGGGGGGGAPGAGQRQPGGGGGFRRGGM